MKIFTGFDDTPALAGALMLLVWLVAESLLQVAGFRQPMATRRESLSLHLLKVPFYGGIVFSWLDAASLHWTIVGARIPLLRWACLPLIVVGISIRLAARVSLGKQFSPYVQTNENHRLVTTGPYRWVRHPAYLGWLILLIAFPVCLGSLGGFACAVLTGIPATFYRIRVEEAALEKWFPDEFPQYQATTCKLIPGLW